MLKTGSEHITSKMLDSASAWYARINGPRAADADIKRHVDWLLADPSHLLAYEQIAETVKSAVHFEEAARATFGDVFKAPQAKSSIFGSLGRALHRISWPQYAVSAATAAAIAFFVILPTTSLYDNPAKPHHFSANEGRVETVKLADGSRVSMFLNAEMTFTVTDDARIVNLSKGRAFFDVVSNHSKPFYVNFSNHQVKVVGTRFEVVHVDGLDRVAVNKGLVSVIMRSSKIKVPTPILIEPGTIIEFQDTSTDPILSKTVPSAVGAWKEGVLVFKEKPLREVVATIDQLFPKNKITLGSTGFDNTYFSGALVISNPETMVKQLAQFLSLKVHASGTTLLLDTK
jgi:transmembrane sensor